jgi:hypothetical protein
MLENVILKRTLCRAFAFFLFLLFLFSQAGWAQVGPVRVAISPANPVLVKSSSQQLEVGQQFFRSEVLRGGALPATAVRWSSSDSTIASVDGNGLIQTTNPGIATITARVGPFQGSTKIIVSDTALTSISVSPAGPTIPNGTSAPLTATGTFADMSTLDITNSVTWSSSDSSMAMVNQHGICRGLKQGGPVTITATYGSISGSTDVTVGAPIVVAISVAPANAQAPLGSVEQFTATALMSDDTQQDITKSATWSASSQVSISATGLATANGLGTATISASMQNVTGSTTWIILAGTRSRYIRTTFPSLASFDLNSAVYDPVRKLVFANNLRENRVDVIAGPDYHAVASIAVPAPMGLELTADGAELLVCSQQSILTINPDTLRIVGRTAVPPTFFSNTPFGIFSTSTGNAFIVMGPANASSMELVEWYRSQGQFVSVNPPHFSGFGGIVRSQDHSKMLVAVENFNVDLYDSASDQFTKTYVSQFNTPAIAANPDGTQFLVGGDVLDSNLTKVGSLPSASISATTYSRDGSRIYLAEPISTAPPAFDIVDSTTLLMIGKAPDLSLAGQPGHTIGLDIDETGILIGWIDSGLSFVDVSKPQPVGKAEPSLTLPTALDPPQGILGQVNLATMHGDGFTTMPSVWFGPSFAPQVTRQDANTLQVVAPSLSAAGPVNVTAVFADGAFSIAPDGFTIGPDILEMLTNSGSTAGGTQVEVLGYGFKFDASQIQVTVGGKPATVTSVSAFPEISPFSFPVHHLKFMTPPGVAGDADVTIQTPAGVTTLARGFQYVDVEAFTNGNTYSQVVYDRSRQNLYLGSSNGKIDVFSLAQQQFLASIVVGGTVKSMALTPDASRLLVANSGDDSIELIDLSTNGVTRIAATDSCFFAGSQPQQVVVTSLNKAFITINSINSLCPAPFTNLRQLDLESLAITNRDIGGTTFITNVNGMAATPDGSQVVMTIQYGPDAIWHSSSDTFFTKSALQGLPVIDADGTIIAMNSAVLDMQLQAIGYAAPSAIAKTFDPFLNVLNEELNPTGSLVYSSYGNRIDIFDTRHGTRRRKIAVGNTTGTSGPFVSGVFAVDETGLRVFAPVSGNISSGFVALTLDSLPLAIGTVNPAQASAAGGTAITIRGSGFQPGSTVAFNNTVVATTWMDQNTLIVTMPPVAPGFVRITVTNPNQERFSLDTAFQAN